MTVAVLSLLTGEKRCDRCGAVFTSAANLRSHILTVHAEEKEKFYCDSCGRAFSRRSYLRVHVIRVHIETITGTE